MEKINFKKLEERATQLFGDKAVVTMAQAKMGNKGYAVKIGIQGMPFEVSAVAKTLEFAIEIATYVLEERINKSLQDDLFKTQDNNCYERLILSEDELARLFKYEDFLSSTYFDEIKAKTVAWVCKVNGRGYECVIESPYKSLHARGYGTTKTTAMLSAILKAQDVFEPELIRADENSVHI